MGSQLDDNIRHVLANVAFFRSMANTLVVAVSTTLLVLFFDSLAAFTFAKFRFPGRNALFVILLAATLDGCGFFGTYRHVALPSARPALAFLGIFTFVASWIDYMWPLIVLTNPDHLTLQVALSQLNRAHGVDYSMAMTGALLAMVPLMIVFVVFARQFVKGATEGAIRG